MTLKEMLKLHEGFRSKVYLDTVGKSTVGYGRNLEDVGVSEDEAELLLDNDIKRATELCRKTFPWFGLIDQVRQDVIVMMCFNLGITRLSRFPNMINAIQKGDWPAAAAQMLNSVWAKQVGHRANVLARMMATGKYV